MSLLEALSEATDSDLEDVEAKLVELEKEVAALKELRKVLAAKLGKDLPKSGRGGRRKVAAGTAEDEDGDGFGRAGTLIARRRTIFEYITANGPQTQAELCKQCSIPTGSISATVDHNFFKQLPDGRIDLIG